jgi:hypothetical protein
MTTRTHEQTINTALGEILQTLGSDWKVRAEEVGQTFEEGGRPDILIERPGGWPIVVEAEVGNHRQAEKEARSRLGNRLTGSTNSIDTSIALVYPDSLRHHHGSALRDAVRGATFEFALLTIQPNKSVLRLPASGFLSGGVRDLALVLHRSSIPTWRAEALTDALEQGVTRAEGDFTSSHPIGSPLGIKVAKTLGQNDDAEGQTRKMAMTVVINALVFHASLAEAEMQVLDSPKGSPRAVKSPGVFRKLGTFAPTPLLDEWEKILAVNYWPIFHAAQEILLAMPTATAVHTLDGLWITAEALVGGGVTKSHDLTGVIFQRLIADRKFLATYYTRPACAALLAGLAMPQNKPLKGKWEDANTLVQCHIGDFACGTGTLLSTAYQRMGLLHEVHGGDSKALHPAMMKDGLVGLDVLNVAVHLTAAMLAGSHPETPFNGECLVTMPYGVDGEWRFLGSLDLLSREAPMRLFEKAARTAGGGGAVEAKYIQSHILHELFDLVIMNPPFTRHGAREGDRAETPNPAFAAFNASEAEQKLLAAHLKTLAAGGCGHGHAGMASYFVDLANRKTAPSGTVAFVLPLSAMSGLSWDAVRGLWRSKYSGVMVVTIAGRSTFSRSFSADTGMAECLVVAIKTPPRKPKENRAIFAILDRQPESVIEGELMAEALSLAVSNGSVRTLEDGPFGGTKVSLGNTLVGEIVDCPLPLEGAWPMVGLSDVSLGQTAFQLEHGRLWVDGMKSKDVAMVPVATIADVSSGMGSHDLDISGAGVKSDGLPQGPFKIISGTPPGAAYPCLWNHETTRERRLLVEPDSHGQIREVKGRVPAAIQERAEGQWATATRAHYSRDLRFNSQSLIVAMTDQPSLGGRAWPSVVFEDRKHEFAFALWCNSTLGLLCHWWMSNKTQDGRGTVTVTSIPLVKTLDVRALTVAQHKAAKSVFTALSKQNLLPFDQVNEDSARAEIDRALLVDVLGLDPALCEPGGPMDRLRRKLAAEPQVHANKQTRLVFTKTGEMSVAR